VTRQAVSLAMHHQLIAHYTKYAAVISIMLTAGYKIVDTARLWSKCCYFKFAKYGETPLLSYAISTPPLEQIFFDSVALEQLTFFFGNGVQFLRLQEIVVDKNIPVKSS
jgi:hypothetical protein